MKIKIYGYNGTKEVYVGTFKTQAAALHAIKKMNLKSYFYYKES